LNAAIHQGAGAIVIPASEAKGQFGHGVCL